jgi:hypothetical protein
LIRISTVIYNEICRALKAALLLIKPEMERHSQAAVNDRPEVERQCLCRDARAAIGGKDQGLTRNERREGYV